MSRKGFGAWDRYSKPGCDVNSSIRDYMVKRRVAAVLR
jgi:hypothetical protein